MKSIKLGILLIISYILQVTALKYTEIFGIAPNLVFITAVCYGLVQVNPMRSFAFGLICGLLLDIGSANIFGLNALLCMNVSAVATFLGAKFFNGKLRVELIFVFLLTVIYEFAYYVLCFSVWSSAAASDALRTVIIPTAVYNTIAAILVLYIIKKIVKPTAA